MSNIKLEANLKPIGNIEQVASTVTSIQILFQDGFDNITRLAQHKPCELFESVSKPDRLTSKTNIDAVYGV